MTTFVSYLGGSAGDMFTASCNGISLQDKGFYNNSVISVSYKPYALKPLESEITSGKIGLDAALFSMPVFDFISTHLFRELEGRNVVSIVVKDEEVFDRIVNRQMYLQKLHIDPNGDVGKIVEQLCRDGKYQNAAKFFFLFSKKLAQTKMKVRLQTTKFPTLDFSNLFTGDFVPSLKSQGWDTNLDVLASNHNYWLPGQPELSEGDSVESIAKKMQEHYE